MRMEYLNEGYELVKNDFKPYTYKIDGQCQRATALSSAQGPREFITINEYRAVTAAYNGLGADHQRILKEVARRAETPVKSGKPVKSLEFETLSTSGQREYMAALTKAGLSHNSPNHLRIIHDHACMNGILGGMPVYEVNGSPVTAARMTPAIVSFYHHANISVANRFFQQFEIELPGAKSPTAIATAMEMLDKEPVVRQARAKRLQP